MADTRDLLNNPAFIQDLHLTGTYSARQLAEKWGCGPTFVKKWRKRRDELGPAMTLATEHQGISNGRSVSEESSTGARSLEAVRDRPVTLEDAREWIEASGDNPEDFNISIRAIAYDYDKFSNKMSAWPKSKGSDKDELPLWPVVQQATPVTITPHKSSISSVDRPTKYKLSLKCADTQIGYRRFGDGTIDPFHDDKAMALFIEVCKLYQPDNITILGDFIDLPSQGRFAQEASFAQTTQLAIDAGHQFLAQLRAVCPDAEIIIIEGNHDLRMQSFIERNALAAFGLKQAGSLPDAWPVMSLPHLLRLKDLNIQYVDSYPAATHWDNALTRNIHGTRANSKGSTMSQYVHELPHVNTWAGHTHRAEIVYRTVLGAHGEAIESYAANPGVLCRTDGGVPSVKGAIGSDGTPAKIVEDWQAGFGMLYYNDTESWPFVYRIKNGTTILDGRIISV